MPRARAFFTRLLRNRDYTGAVALGYAQMLINALVQMTLVPLYLRTLGDYRFGVLMILLSIVTYAQVGITWMTGGLQRTLGEFVASGDDERLADTYSLSKTVYWSYAVAIGGALWLGTFFLGPRLLHDAPPGFARELDIAVAIIAIYIVAMWDLHVDRMVLIARRRQAFANGILIVGALALAAVVVPLLRHDFGIASVAVALLASSLAPKAICWAYWRYTRISLRWSWPTSTMRPLFARLVGPMGMGYMLYGILGLTSQLDSILIGLIGGARAAGQFVIAWKIADTGTQMLWRLAEFATPYLIQMDARGDTAKMRTVYSDGSRALLVLSCLAGLSYGLAGPSLTRWWVGPHSAPSGRLLYVFAGAAIVWLATARLPAVFAYSTVRLRDLNAIAAIEAGGKVVLTLVLFSSLGIMAPLVAISIVHMGGVARAYRRLVRP